MRVRAAASWVVVAIVLAGCAAPDVAPPAPSSRYDLFLADGWSPIGAQLLADTTVDIAGANDTNVHLVETLPFGTLMDVTYVFRPGERRAPSLEESGRALLALHATTGGTHERPSYQWSYFVPYSALPPGTLARLRGEGVTSAMSLSPFGTARAQGGDAGEGVGVEVSAVFDEAQDVMMAKMEEYVLEAVQSRYAPGAGSPGNPISQLISSSGDVLEAATTLRPEHVKWMERLKQARACAEDPANELTKKAYAEDPTYKQTVLDEIDAAIAHVNSNTAARFVGAETKVGAGLVPNPVAATIMGLIAAPIVAHTDAQLAALSEERVQQIERMIQGFCTCASKPPGPGGEDATGSKSGESGSGGSSEGPMTLPPLECSPGFHLTYTGRVVGTYSFQRVEGDRTETGEGRFVHSFEWTATIEAGPNTGPQGFADTRLRSTAELVSKIVATDRFGTDTVEWTCPRTAVVPPLTVSAQGASDGQGEWTISISASPKDIPGWTCTTRGTDAKGRTTTIDSTSEFPLVALAGTDDAWEPNSVEIVLRPGDSASFDIAGGGEIPKGSPAILPTQYCTYIVGFLYYEESRGSCTWSGTLFATWV